MKFLLRFSAFLWMFMVLSSCRSMKRADDPDEPKLMDRHWRSFDGKVMPWTKGAPVKDASPRAVVITVHGLNGAASDFWQLARDWPQHGFAIYGLELRGQGNDPVVIERGDVTKAQVWFRDLKAFHQLVKQKHPGVPIYWYAESMGTLVAIHTLARRSWRLRDMPDGLILSAPPAGLRRPPKGVKKAAIHSLIAFLPWKRVDLEKLGSSNMENLKVTKDSTLKEQSQKTPHYVPRQTLRLLGEIDWMIQELPASAGRVRMPTLVLGSPNDAVASEAQIQQLFEEISAQDKTLNWYRQSYHLLLHDVERDQVYADVTGWMEKQVGQPEATKKLRGLRKRRLSLPRLLKPMEIVGPPVFLMIQEQAEVEKTETPEAVEMPPLESQAASQPKMASEAPSEAAMETANEAKADERAD